MKYKRNIKPNAAKEYISPEASRFAARSRQQTTFGAPHWTAIMKDKFQEFMFMTMDAGLSMEHAWVSMNDKMLLGPDYRSGTPEYNRSSYARAVMQMNDGKSWTDIRMERMGKTKKPQQTKLADKQHSSVPKDFIVQPGDKGRIAGFTPGSPMVQIARRGFFWYVIPKGFVPLPGNPIIRTDAAGVRTYKVTGEFTVDMAKDDPLVQRLLDDVLLESLERAKP